MSQALRPVSLLIVASDGRLPERSQLRVCSGSNLDDNVSQMLAQKYLIH